MITPQHSEESLFRSYLTAIVGRARHVLSWDRNFDYGVDGSIKHVERRGTRLTESGYCLDFQGKASVKWSIIGDEVIYDLEAKSFNDLISRASRPRAQPMVLILLCLPEDDKKWINVSEDQMLIRNCAYLHSLKGGPTTNTGTARIRISRSNCLTPDKLNEVLEQISEGTFNL